MMLGGQGVGETGKHWKRKINMNKIYEVAKNRQNIVLENCINKRWGVLCFIFSWAHIGKLAFCLSNGLSAMA